MGLGREITVGAVLMREKWGIADSSKPMQIDDFLGGDLQWAAGLSLITPMPKRPEWPLKGHFFLNAGRLVAFNKGRCSAF